MGLYIWTQHNLDPKENPHQLTCHSSNDSQPCSWLPQLYIAIWNLLDEEFLGNPVCLAKNSNEIESVAVNGSHIVAAVAKKIELWDRKLILGPLTGHKDVVTHMAFSEDRVHLVSGSIDRTIQVWDVGIEIGMSLGGCPDGSKIEPTGWNRGLK
ncbi:hypothetical protein B0H10DRAFT_1950731 [Mycena sp. CBHHK59/15]|nr:hypothetical protein B0H10DRAFT_1950731 [Mycena sp. CBHHK59/15]